MVPNQQDPGAFNRGVTRITIEDIIDGTSNVLLWASGMQRSARPAGRSAGIALSCSRARRSIVPRGRALDGHVAELRGVELSRRRSDFCFADGSVKFLSDALDHRVYAYLGDKSDQEHRPGSGLLSSMASNGGPISEHRSASSSWTVDSDHARRGFAVE